VLVAVVGAFSCGDHRVLVGPPDPSARSMIVVVFDDVSTSVHAINLDDQIAFRFSPRSDRSRVYVLTYACARDHLSVQFATDGAVLIDQTSGIQLPEERALYQLDLQSKAYTQLKYRPPELQGLRVSSAPQPCASLEAVSATIPFVGRFTGEVQVIRRDADSFYVLALSVAEAQVFLATRTATAVSVRRLAGTYPFAEAAFKRSPSEIWLFERSGLVSRGNFETGFVNSSTTGPFGETIGGFPSVDGAPSNEPFEIDLITGAGRLFQFDGNKWTTLSSNRSCNNCSETPGILWLAPQLFLVGRPATDGMTRVEAGRLETIPVEASFSLGTYEHFALNGGVVHAATCIGVLCDVSKSLDLGRSWSLEAGSVAPIRMVVALNGRVFVSSNGLVHELHSRSDCPVLDLGVDISTGTIAGDRMFILSQNSASALIANFVSVSAAPIVSCQ
jgi:hypothetical protein